MAAPLKPRILICVTPIYGHYSPIALVAKGLITNGYEVTFVTSKVYAARIKAMGASLVPLSGYSDFTEVDVDRLWPSRYDKAYGMEQFAYDTTHLFINPIPSQYETYQKALRMLTALDDRPVVVLNESDFFGQVPGLLGAPGLRPKGVIGLGIIPLALSSKDTAPFGTGLPPDSSPEGRVRNKSALEHTYEVIYKEPTEAYHAMLKECGVQLDVTTVPYFFDANILLADSFLQLCVPSVEYPRSDAPKTLHFTGGLPKQKREIIEASQFPSWWSEIKEVSRLGGKKIVFVSQGTATTAYDNLVIPTIEALRCRNDLILIVALGTRGASLPGAVNIPSNCRVADYIPYDEVLEMAHVFVFNGGYGGFQQGLIHAVPQVMAGLSEEKIEVTARATWAGVAIDLKSNKPSVEAIAAAVDAILAEDHYKKRASEVAAEMIGLDPIGIIIRHIEEVASRIM